MNIQGITPNSGAPQEAQTASSTHAATSGSSGASSGSTGLMGGSSTNLQDTFLSLLVTELQNQDPTSPVDPTQMVGQMVSLNQLDQLIAMNQTLTSMAGGTAASSSSASGAATAKAQVASTDTSGSSGLQSSPRLAGASTSTQVQSAYSPVDPNAMMNLYGSVAGTGSNTSLTTSGGK